jgi:hypothetical protein
VRHGGLDRPDCYTADRSLGNSVGAIEWPRGVTRVLRRRPTRPGPPFAVFPNSRNRSVPLTGGFPGALPRGRRVGVQDSYLVDSASSHMLVSKIKPCMSKYKQLYRETANGSLNQLSFI